MTKTKARATEGGTATASTRSDPVVDLSDQLFALWNADEGSQIECASFDDPTIARDLQQQFSDWQGAVATMISFTRATSPAGALVQLALAMDALDSLLNTDACGTAERQVRQLCGVDEHRIERLVRSAMQAVQKSLGAGFEPVRGIVEIYAGDDDDWLDNVPQWEREGQARRKSQQG